MTLIYNATFDKNTRKLSFEDKAGNEIYSFIVPEREKDDLTKPLTLRATQDGSTVKLTKYGSPSGTFQTSSDGGNTWTDYTIDTAITLNTGDEVSFRAKADRSAQSDSNYFYFRMEGKIEAWHNVMSMIRTSDFATYKSVVDYAFSRLFMSCSSLTKAPALPATTLADSCYWDMFSSCLSLTKAPELPATALAVDCYYGMFRSCGSLVKAPELSATTLSTHCYTNMFDGCRSLNEVRCKIPSSYSSSDISSNYARYWLYGVSSTGTFYTNADANWPSGLSGIPEGWTRVNKEAPAVDDITKPLTFKATQDGSTVKLTKYGSPSGTFQTSSDGGNTWTDYTIDTAITLNTGDEVSFRAKADRSAQSDSNYFYFEMTGKIEAWHNVMSMYRTSDFATYESVVENAFDSLFMGCSSLTKAPALPATTLAIRCYASMFSGCHSLTEAPVLPATTLADSCYRGMFGSCRSLTKAPELPATTLVDNCYSFMFSGCHSLTEAPVLPATTLAYDCYWNMFEYCKSLTKAPELPATTLAISCYWGMFSGCQSLTKAPELPATTLADNCYRGMFSGCQSLKEVRISATTTALSALAGWLYSVSATGDFYCDPNATIFPTGESGIPANWVRRNIADYPVTP